MSHHPHNHLCLNCSTWWSCRGEHCEARIHERCDECQPQAAPAEREHLCDRSGTVSGCFRRLPAEGCE